MSEKKVNFPKYINRPKIFFIFELDILAVAIFSFILAYAMMMFAGFNIGIIMIFSMLFAYLSVRLTIYFKAKTAKGALFHLLYSKGVWVPKIDEDRHQDIIELGSKNFLPKGWEHEFAD